MPRSSTPGDVWVGLATGYWRGRQQPANRRAGRERGGRYHAALQAGGSSLSITSATQTGFRKTDSGVCRSTESFVIADPVARAECYRRRGDAAPRIFAGQRAPIGWALPVNLEAQRGDARIYGSAGYFSRGSMFATIGADVPMTSRVIDQRNLRPVVRAGGNASDIAWRRSVARR